MNDQQTINEIVSKKITLSDEASRCATSCKRNYCKDIIKFFCKEYIQPRYNTSTLVPNLSRQIDRYLVDNNFIHKYKIDLQELPISERRDIKIDSILTNIDPRQTIKIYFQIAKALEVDVVTFHF